MLSRAAVLTLRQPAVVPSVDLSAMLRDGACAAGPAGRVPIGACREQGTITILTASASPATTIRLEPIQETDDCAQHAPPGPAHPKLQHHR